MLSALTALFFIAVLPSAADSSNNDPEQWQVIDKEFRVRYFPITFWDSLRTVNKSGKNRSLRTVDAPLHMRAEKFVYVAQWGPFKAGYAVLTNIPDTATNTMRLCIKGMTNRFVSAFYEVRDFMCSTIDAGGLYPLVFEEHVHEGRYRANRWVIYDHANTMAHSNKKEYPHVEIIPYAHDLMSLLYFVRSMELAPSDTFTINCFVQGKNYPVFFKCTERKRIEVEAGTFKCLGLQPHLMGEGRNFSKRDKVLIWLTDDTRHIPVLVKSKIKVGSVIGELVYYE